MKCKNVKTPSVSGGQLPIYDSMAACEGATGIPKAVVQQAKREGCDAVDSHSRVHLGKLLRWLYRPGSGDDGAGVNWPDRLKRAQALKAEAELERIKGGLVSIDEVHAQQTACVAKARAILTQKFETELPAKCDGMPAVKIAEQNVAALDEVFTVLGREETYS